MRAGQRGAILVAVLLVSAAVWALLGGALLIARLNLEVAVATRDHAIARAKAEQLIEERRETTPWPPDATSLEAEGQDGGCEWQVSVLANDALAVRYEARVEYGRARVTIDATMHEPLATPHPP